MRRWEDYDVILLVFGTCPSIEHSRSIVVGAGVGTVFESREREREWSFEDAGPLLLRIEFLPFERKNTGGCDN